MRDHINSSKIFLITENCVDDNRLGESAIRTNNIDYTT